MMGIMALVYLIYNTKGLFHKYFGYKNIKRVILMTIFTFFSDVFELN